MQDQEKLAAEIEKRERRDSAAAAGPNPNPTSTPHHQDHLTPTKDRSGSGGSESPILNLTKGLNHHQQQQHHHKDDSNGQDEQQQQQQHHLKPHLESSSSLRLGSSGTRGPGSESPDELMEAMSEDEEDLSEDTPKKQNKEQDKTNNNKEEMINPSLAAAIPGLAALGQTPAGAAAPGGVLPDGGSNNMGSVYGVLSNLQTWLKVVAENAKQEERKLLTSQKGEGKMIMITHIRQRWAWVWFEAGGSFGILTMGVRVIFMWGKNM